DPFELLMNLRATVVHYNTLVDDYCITSKPRNLCGGDGDKMGYVIFDNSARIRIECRRVEERLFVREGTETGVEMVEPFAGKYKGENLLLDDFSDLLMSTNVRADVVSGKPRISAFQQIAFSLKEHTSELSHVSISY